MMIRGLSAWGRDFVSTRPILRDSGCKALLGCHGLAGAAGAT